ncbi:hypothetical protein BAnh1_10790 [Bartonella australis AUST/NH1]|uniref:DUF4167 domain-containing protein n=1 Tax=Bartonella australis (strain Aust/NH1) TaxID=1094489 RepID=M1NZX2_BARAA|nr:DUF4167 domain-containing protein [Bartonella australis]AGF74947.1 hypothetical protein BAnh1_10790 [Bartonella australis AUST/NH1]
MRPQQNRRARGRNNNNNNRRGPNPLSRNYESNGPDAKIRGNAQQIADKYVSLARDAQGAGDRVMSENYLQHAEHYLRIILSAAGQMTQSAQRDENSEQDNEEISAEDVKEDDVNSDELMAREQPRRNSDERRSIGQNGQACDALANDASPKNKIAGESSETAKKTRRLPRRRAARPQEEPSFEFSQKNSEFSEKKATPPGVVSLPLLSEEAQKKPRRRRMATSSAEENI